MEIKIDASKSAVFVIGGALTLLVIYVLYDKFVSIKSVSIKQPDYSSIIKLLNDGLVNESAINEIRKNREEFKTNKRAVNVPITKVKVDSNIKEMPKVKRKYNKRKK